VNSTHSVAAHWGGEFDESGLQQWAESLRRQLPGEHPSLGLVFMTPRYFPQAKQVLEILQVHAQIPLLVGCSSESLIAGGEEIEEEAGIALNRGWVVVDDLMRTNLPGIFAIGDVTGRLPLAHVASAQGILAVEQIAGMEVSPLDMDAIPRCTYCQPQVASIGLSEAQARQRGFDVRVGRFPFLANGKALALGDHDGFVKLVADGASGRLLGAHLVGPEVTELLPELVLARAAALSPEQIARAVHAHPTLSEALMEAAHALLGRAIHI